MSGAIGIGVLSLPHALVEAGLVLGVIFLIIGAGISYWSLNCLVYAGFKTGTVNYSEMIEKRFGRVIVI